MLEHINALFLSAKQGMGKSFVVVIYLYTPLSSSTTFFTFYLTTFTVFMYFIIVVRVLRVWTLLARATVRVRIGLREEAPTSAF